MVNLAAVNYHFGSKENLVDEVFRQQLDKLYTRRRELLAELKESYPDTTPPLDAILTAFVTPALVYGASRDTSNADFVRLLARAFSERSDYLRHFLSVNYGDINSEFFQLMALHLEHLPESVSHLRIGYAVGALTYTMADFNHHEASVDEMVKQLVEFTVAGLTAPLP